MNRVSDSQVVEDVRQCVLSAYDKLEPKTDEDRAINAELIAHVTKWFHSSDRRVTHAAKSCLDRFIAAELDYVTAGNRGMGRMSEYWPRFGGKHREKLRTNSTWSVDEFARIFGRHISCGYFFVEYLIECFSGKNFDRDTRMESASALFDQWIPMIYSPTGPPAFDKAMEEGGGEQYYTLKGLWGQSTGNAIHERMRRCTITIGEFEGVLIRQYFDAGIILRVLESRPLSEDAIRDVATGGAYSLERRGALNRAKSGCAGILLAFAFLMTLVFISAGWHEGF
jgi:hypothetical protein